MDYLKSSLDMILTNVPQLLGALAVLIIGWIIAKFIASKIGKVIEKNEKLKSLFSKFSGEGDTEVKVSKIIVKFVYYILMIFVITAVFESLGFSILTQPLTQFLGSIFTFLPQLIGAVVLFVVAWITATVVKLIVVKALKIIKLDEKIKGDSEAEVSISKPIGDILFWFIFLVFLPGILSALSMEGILEPIQNLLNKILESFPNIFAAIAIILIGWFIAKKVKEASTQIFSSLGVDKMNEKNNSSQDSMKLSVILGTIIYVLILIPVVVSGFDMIGLTVVTIPAMNMMDGIMSFLPNLFSAIVIIYLAYFVGNILGELVSGIVSNLKLESVLIDIGLLSSKGKDNNISKLIGNLVKVAIIFFAILEASNILGFGQLTLLVDQFIVLVGQIILGLVIIGIGLYLAQLFANIINKRESTSSGILAIVAKSTIIFLSLAMGLRQMGIANEIINMAFGFTIGAIAVASAIAFGIGGKDTASKLLAKFEKK